MDALGVHSRHGVACDVISKRNVSPRRMSLSLRSMNSRNCWDICTTLTQPYQDKSMENAVEHFHISLPAAYAFWSFL